MNNGEELAGRVKKEDDGEIELEIPLTEEGTPFVEEGDAAQTDTGAHGNKPPAEKQDTADQQEPAASGAKTAPVKVIKVNKAEVKERTHNLSSMPDDISESLTRFELRDLVEYLASLK